jgi:hypothetical protein
LWEHKPHFIGEKAGKELLAERQALGLPQPTAAKRSKQAIHDTALAVDEENAWGLRDGLFLIRNDNADPNAPVETDSHGDKIGLNPEAADWTIVPFFRPASTDLNMTLAFALIAMVMVQYYGFKHLGGGLPDQVLPVSSRKAGEIRLRKTPSPPSTRRSVCWN